MSRNNNEILIDSFFHIEKNEEVNIPVVKEDECVVTNKSIISTTPSDFLGGVEFFFSQPL